MGFVVPLTKLSFVDRGLLAVKTFAWYLMKMVWPLDLTPIYGLPYRVSMSIPETAGLLLFFAAVTALCIFLWYRRRKFWLAIWIYYLMMLLPVSIIKVSSSSFAHDRYTYMPGIGPFLLAGLAAATIYGKVTGLKRGRMIFKIASVSVAFAVLISLSYLTIRQIGIWKNSFVFWNYVIEKEPEKTPGAYYNMGVEFRTKGRFDEAIEMFQTALELKPDYADAHYNLGLTYQSKGLPDKAIEQYQAALSLKLDDMETHNNLGVAYMSKGLFDKAIEQFQAALTLSPDNAQAHYNLGNAYMSKGLFDKAIEQYRTALTLRPDYAKARKNLGFAYARKGLRN